MKIPFAPKARIYVQLKIRSGTPKYVHRLNLVELKKTEPFTGKAQRVLDLRNE